MLLKHKAIVTLVTIFVTVSVVAVGHGYDQKGYSFTQNFGAVVGPNDNEFPTETFRYEGDLKQIYQAGVKELIANDWYLDREKWNKGIATLFRGEGEVAIFEFDPLATKDGKGSGTWSISRFKGWMGLFSKLRGPVGRR